MKDIKDDEIQFVVNHYKEGKLNTDDAWKKFNNGKHRPRIISIRHIAVAAAAVFAICIVAAIVVTVYNHNTDVSVAHKEYGKTIVADSTDSKLQDSTKIFRYSNEPIRNVMRDLSVYYGCRFIVNDTTKKVSGEFEVSSPKEAANVIEKTLDVKIRIE